MLGATELAKTGLHLELKAVEVGSSPTLDVKWIP